MKSAVKTDGIVLGDQKLGAIFGVSTKTVYAWRLAGMPCRPAGREFTYDLKTVRPWVEAYRRNNSSEGEMSPFAKVKLGKEMELLKLARVKAAQAEREEEVARGNVLDRADWELFAIESIQMARDALMRIPMNFCKHVPAKYHRTIREEGKREIERILTQLARNLETGPSD